MQLGRGWTWAVAVAFALLCSLEGCGADDEGTCNNSQCGPCEGIVKRALDGDTIELTNGRKVRYLLVDTPESTSGKDECYGAEAAAFNADLVVGQTVHLDYESDCEDMFGRLLAWVKVADREVNSLLIERGYGCVLYLAPIGEDRVDDLKALQSQAKQAKKGMWGACAEVACEK